MFDRYLTEVSDVYAAMLADDRTISNELYAGWFALADDSADRAAGIRLLLNVQETADAEPYLDAVAMVADIASGRFLVSTAHCEHPIWTPAENVNFRIVHDVLGHYAASMSIIGCGRIGASPEFVAGFDWAGENRACRRHFSLLPTRDARKALFTECIAQTGYAIANDGFGEQVIGFADHYPQADDPAFTAEYRKVIR